MTNDLKVKKLADASGVDGVLALRGADVVVVPATSLRGDRGEKGDKGDSVRPTIHDLVDFIGPQGDQGVQGEVGPQGEKGDTGADSFVAGPQGPQGEKGDKGDRGDVGPVGPRGPKGERGSDGANGKDGQDGADGAPGKDGAPAELPQGAKENDVLVFKKGQWQASKPTDQAVGGTGQRMRLNRIEADIQVIGGIGAPLGGGSYVIDGGGAAIAVGNKYGWRCTVDGNIAELSLAVNSAATGQVDIWRATNFPPTVSDTIFSAGKLTLTNTLYKTQTSMTGVNTQVSAGDWFYFNVDSMSNATWANVYIKLVRRVALP